MSKYRAEIRRKGRQHREIYGGGFNFVKKEW